MKITQVSYQMLRVTKQFENDRAEVVIQLDEGDNVQEALEKARLECDTALASGRDASLRDKLKEKMSTPEGRASLEKYLTRCC